MSATDKAKLDGIAEGATKVTNSDIDGRIDTKLTAYTTAHKGVDKVGTVTSVSVGEGLVITGDKAVAPTISFSTENVFT